MEFPPGLELGETAGKGGSSTSESVRTGSGAWVGGRLAGAISCNRAPGLAGNIKLGICLPIFKQRFPASTQSTKLFITEKCIMYMRARKKCRKEGLTEKEREYQSILPVVIVKCGFL